VKRKTTRRGFIKDVAVGAGGVTLASSFQSALPSTQSAGVAIGACGAKYQQYILAPQIKTYRDLQVFEITGKDARGYDFVVQLSPTEAISPMNETPEAVNADRVRAYIGGDTGNVKDIGEIELSMGKEQEIYKIDSASVLYIPKGTPHRQRLLKQPPKGSFVLTLTLPPKYVQPNKK
jgi:hypothetical protein